MRKMVKFNESKKIKRTATGFFALTAMLFILAGSFSASAAVRPNVVVSGFRVEEGSANVGKEFTLLLNLVNTEPGACALNDVTTIQVGAPFIMNGVGTVPAGNICADSVKTVSFPMKIDPTATGGTYQITVMNSFETSLLAQYSSTNTINLFVNGTPDMDAHIVNSNPMDVYPGDTATLTLSISNNGAFQAQAVTASMSSDNPLVVKWGNSFSSLGAIEARQTRTADFSVEVPKDAKSDHYPLALTVQYLDQDLTRQTKEFHFTFNVKEKAMFDTSDSGSDTLYTNGNSRMARLMLKNTGTDTAFKIKAKLQPQYPFSTDGSVRYVDKLQPGQSAPVDFVVDIDKDGKVGMYGLNLILDFEDKQGNQLHDTATVSLAIQRKGIIQGVFIDFWYLWIVAIVTSILVVRRKMAKKK
jgi:hypothetical protein